MFKHKNSVFLLLSGVYPDVQIGFPYVGKITFYKPDIYVSVHS